MCVRFFCNAEAVKDLNSNRILFCFKAAMQHTNALQLADTFLLICHTVRVLQQSDLSLCAVASCLCTIKLILQTVQYFMRLV